MKYLIAPFIFIFSIQCNAQNDQASVFLVKPYLQIGNNPNPNSMQLLWHATGESAQWVLEYKTGTASGWTKSETQSSSKIDVAGTEPFRVYNASLNALQPGTSFIYRVLKNGNQVFSAEGKSLKGTNQSYRFVVSGDMGAGTKQAREIANGIYQSNPDLVAIAGDIAYNQGMISEYKAKFWPVFNADNADMNGVPLMRSVPFIAAVGNHDADTRDLDRFPGALAFYHFWDQPLNGPIGKEGGPFVPQLKGSDQNKKAFLDGAGEKYPRMTNYSFDYGNAHWTVIDSDTYVDWTDSLLRDWVIKDLEKAKNATWRFVIYHHPGFKSSRAHYEQQQMRLVAPILEKGNVDIVFSGHVHNYQRSFPMTFVPDRTGTVIVRGTNNNIIHGRVVNGKWTLDKTFDGKKNTKPQGVIYIVTGAGGQGLYNPDQTKDTDSWQKFTDKFESTVHSFTVVDVNGKTLTLRQVDVNGKEVDRFEIKK
jgi:predicted phosphodiesterase